MSKLLQFLTEPAHLLTVIAAAACLWMLHEYLRRRKHRLLAFLTGSGSGIAALWLIWLHGGLFGYHPRLTLRYGGSLRDPRLAAALAAGTVPCLARLSEQNPFHD